MDNLLRWRIFLALIVSVTILACARSQPAAPEKDDLAGKKLSALKEQLPKAIAKAAKEDLLMFYKVVVELARRTGPSDAKITLVLQGPGNFVRCQADSTHLAMHGENPDPPEWWDRHIDDVDWLS
jgi:hypothetical protein